MNLVKTALAGLLLAALLATLLPAQPTAPVLNPALARPDGLVGDLDGPGTGLAYLEDSRLLIVASEGGLAYIPDDAMQGIRSGDGPQSLPSDHHGALLAVVPVAGGFAVSGTDGKVRFWTGVKAVARTVDAGGPVRALAAAPDGKTLALAGDDGLIAVLTGDKPPTRLEGAVDWQMAVAFAPDGKTLAAGGYDGHWRLWDLTTGKKTLDIEALPPIAPPPPGTPPRPANVISALAFSPDGKTLASAAAMAWSISFRPTTANSCAVSPATPAPSPPWPSTREVRSSCRVRRIAPCVSGTPPTRCP